MSALVLALILQAAAAPPEDIVVATRRYDTTKGVMRRNLLTGKTECVVRQTSGDPAIDKGVCDVGTSCIKLTRKRDAFAACMTAGRARFLDEYFAAKQADDAQDR